MTAKYDRALDGIRDSKALLRVFREIGAALERDQENVSHVVVEPPSFFSSVQVGKTPVSKEK